MNVNSANSVNFTGLIPTRVFINGLPATDEKFIRQACNKATALLAGPVKEQPQYRDFIIKLGKLDSDFVPQASWIGYGKYFANGKNKKSDFFRIIFDINKRAYITTGKDTKLLEDSGHNIGREKSICNEYNLHTSIDHQNARYYYKNVLDTIIKNIDKLKIQHVQRRGDGSIVRQPVSMDIYVTAKPTRENGKHILKKMKVEDLKLTLE